MVGDDGHLARIFCQLTLQAAMAEAEINMIPP